ncbi:glycosyltransferase family 61 protein [Nitrospirillum pindoramense]|uniref:Uncharacterized protein DUF563 n=1 Tax=Nitrospirillum amazonense TaxID=28077 RepID=A0A560H4K4_9PROT|nr:glycosyltransferase family 61 protein [Nitrospirillum amazonense]TWB41178.1 uncharacterized protein DUF563 [Nitrospirillum amazonense]
MSSELILKECTEAWGGEQFISGPPPGIREFKNVIYMPKRRGVPAFETDQAWGVYDCNGKLLDACSYRRGVDRKLVGQSDCIDPVNFQNINEAPKDIYFYGGPLHWHFGHFLTSTLARFWPYNYLKKSQLPILIHSSFGTSDWLNQNYAVDIFSALGVELQNMECFTSPTLIRRLVVPLPAFEEQSYVHSVMGELYGEIRKTVLRSNALEISSSPLYLSKHKLTSGVSFIENEFEMVNWFESNGVQVVCPEQMGFAEQLALYQSERVVIGSIGSALHTTALSGKKLRVIGYGWLNAINSNFLLLDKVSCNSVSYFFPEGRIYKVSGSHSFSLTLRLAEPHRIAQALLAAASR